MTLDGLSDRLSQLYFTARWLIVAEAAVSATAMIEQLREWGGDEFLVIAGAAGVGDQPGAETLFMPSAPGSIMEGFRRFAEHVADPPVGVREAVLRFDPDRSARVLGPMFAVPGTFLGRRLYGSRPTEWEALEDKTLVDEIWDAAAVPRADAVVVPLADAPAAAAEMAGPHGTVWAADNTEGWHGGGEYTRWVADAAAAREVEAEFAGRARRVRVMPFLDGVPCSIHGVVTADGVASLRPVELLVLRRADRRGFVYAGVATTWDPPSDTRGQMRDAARAVGEVLRARVGFRGPFSIDGVATPDGFRPTELNPRFSVGYAIQAGTVPELHGPFFVRALLEGDVDVPYQELEDAIVTGADATRAVRLGVAMAAVLPAASMGLALNGRRVVATGDASNLELGSSPSGSFMLWRPDPTTLPVGEAFGPYATQAIRVATERWDLDLPAVESSGEDPRLPA